MGDLFNLNQPAVDESFDREKKAANELLAIQLKNAQALANMRTKLLGKLCDEALEEGQAVEEYLAQYGLQQRLAALAAELDARKAGQSEQLDLLQTTQKQATADLIKAETKLADIRKRRLVEEAKLQTQQLDDLAKAEADIFQTRQENLETLRQAEQEIIKCKIEGVDKYEAYLRMASRKRPRQKDAGAGPEELFAEYKVEQPRVDPNVVVQDWATQFDKKASAAMDRNQQKAEQDMIAQFQGLFNLGHSKSEILEKTSRYSGLTSDDDTAIQQRAESSINYDARSQEIEDDLKADQVAQANEVAQILMDAQLAGIELEQEAVEAEVALRHQSTINELEQRRLSLDNELKEERDQATKFIKDREKTEKAQKKLDANKKKEESKFGQSKVGQGLAAAKTLTNPFGEMKDRIAAGEDPEKATEEAQKKLDNALATVGNWITTLANTGKQSTAKQSAVDTRLQGSTINDTKLGSYWRRIDTDISKYVGISPFVLQSKVADSVESLASQGISFNLQQRAILDALHHKIATTFDAADGTLLKLIRIQQADTTAARLGMESALTSFLNSMYETSEFMQSTAKSIRDNLYEATALMGAKEATDYEFQVQKWLGSLYSVGFSASEKVSDALGKLTAGDISGITEGGIGNLLIMAANKANLPIDQILEGGLSASQTDLLLESMVKYLADIYAETKESRVLAQQYGGVFGVSAADLKAAARLVEESTMTRITETDLGYSDMVNQLFDMANTMALRTSTGELFENVKENFTYTLATTLANNPVLSGLNNMANMLNDLVGGIEIPFVNVMGFGFDLNATVADLMNVAALSGTVLGGMGKMIASLGSGGGFSGSGLLNAFGIENSGSPVQMQRGKSGLNALSRGTSTSESGLVGNESGDDIKQKTLADASEGPEKQIAEAKEEQEEKENARTALIAGHIIDIYNLLSDVTLGSKKLHVQLDVGNAPTSWSPGTWN